MKFLVDAHIPPGVCTFLQSKGHDALHTSSLPNGNATADREIKEQSVREQRVVFSKDSDFFFSCLVENKPWKLLLLKTGNISKAELIAILERNLGAIITALENHTIVELDRTSVRSFP